MKLRRRERRSENDRDYAEALGLENDPIDAVCECGRATCFATVRMTRATYTSTRSHPMYFVVCKGHEHETDVVVSRTKTFVIVKPA